MIKRWEIRENTVTETSVYLLLIEGTEDSAKKISSELSAFCRLIDVSIPPFTHVFELYNIIDDSMLEKIRIRIEEISQYIGIEGDVNERTKHVNLDVISPETQIFGNSGNDNGQTEEPTVFMEEPEDNKEPEITVEQEPQRQETVLPKTEPYIVGVKAPRQAAAAERTQVPAGKNNEAPAKPWMPPAVKPRIPAVKPQLLKPKPSFRAMKPLVSYPVKKQNAAPAAAAKPFAARTVQNTSAVAAPKTVLQKPAAQRPVLQKTAAANTAFKRPVPAKTMLQRPAVQKTAVQRPVLQKTPAANTAFQRPAPAKTMLQRPAVQKTAAQRPGLQRPAFQRPVLPKAANLHGRSVQAKTTESDDFKLKTVSPRHTSFSPVPVNIVPDKKELFEPTQIKERKVSPSDIFVQDSTDNKVHLSAGEFSVKMDSANISSLEVSPDNDMDVGDGTFINLSGAEGTMLKKIDTSEYNISAEDSSSANVGIATLIGGKYHDEPVDEVNEKVQSLKLMGSSANGINNQQDLYNGQPGINGNVELDKSSNSLNIANDEILQRDPVQMQVAGNTKLAAASLGASDYNTNAAAVQPVMNTVGQVNPAVKANTEKTGGIMEFINKIVALITAKINSFSNKQQQAPLAYNKEITPQDDFNEMLQKEQAKNFAGQPDSYAAQTPAQAQVQAQVQAKPQPSSANGVKLSAQKPEVKNPFANLGSMPKRDTVIVPKGSAEFRKAVAEMNKNKPVTVNGVLPETGQETSLSAKIQVDDIFSAETIYESYDNSGDDYSAAAQVFKETENSANIRQAAASALNQAGSRGTAADLEVPNIFSTTPKKENKTVVAPAPKPQTGINGNQAKQAAPAAVKLSAQRPVSKPVAGGAAGSLNKTAVNRNFASKTIFTANTGLPKAAVRKPVAANMHKMTGTFANKTMISPSAQKTMLKPAAFTARSSSPLPAAQKTMLRPLKAAVPAGAKKMPKPVFPSLKGNTVKKF